MFIHVLLEPNYDISLNVIFSGILPIFPVIILTLTFFFMKKKSRQNIFWQFHILGIFENLRPCQKFHYQNDRKNED